MQPQLERGWHDTEMHCQCLSAPPFLCPLSTSPHPHIHTFLKSKPLVSASVLFPSRGDIVSPELSAGSPSTCCLPTALARMQVPWGLMTLDISAMLTPHPPAAWGLSGIGVAEAGGTPSSSKIVCPSSKSQSVPLFVWASLACWHATSAQFYLSG